MSNQKRKTMATWFSSFQSEKKNCALKLILTGRFDWDSQVSHIHTHKHLWRLITEDKHNKLGLRVIWFWYWTPATMASHRLHLRASIVFIPLLRWFTSQLTFVAFNSQKKEQKLWIQTQKRSRNEVKRKKRAKSQLCVLIFLVRGKRNCNGRVSFCLWNVLSIMCLWSTPIKHASS